MRSPRVIDPVRLWAIARKETLQLRRDPRSLLLAFGLPLALLVLFGYAITWDLNDVPLAVVDQDRTARSRELIDAFLAPGLFTLVASLDDTGPVEALFEHRSARLALVIPPGFAADLDAGRTVAVQALADGGDANTATLALGYAQGIVRSFSERVALHGVPASTPIRTNTRVWFNEELRSRNMIVPGLVAVIMMIIAAMLTSLTIAREWERGTMEQLAATPVTRLEVVLGKLLPYLAIGLIDLAACSVLGVLLFGVPFRGSALLLLVLSFFFLLGSLGLGLFISAAARSQLLATQMAMLATFLPAYLLSGFMFSIDAMPAPLRVITYVVPARYFLVVTRGIFLKGVGIEALYMHALPMVAYAGIGLVLAVSAFRKELR
jgi:ABC-2 type transport system permease protein